MLPVETRMHDLTNTGSALRPASPAVIVFPGDSRWADARRAGNLAVDQRPAAVALPESVAELLAVIDYAQIVGLRVAVHGAGDRATLARYDGTLLVVTAWMSPAEIDADGIDDLVAELQTNDGHTFC
jgi:FAD/FMN-containing dehydrogenase